MGKEVTVHYTIGDVYRIRGSRKRRIVAVPSDTSVKLKDRDQIITGAQSYVFDISDEPGPLQTGTLVTAFPNSEFVLGIKGVIRSIDLVKGLFRLSTEKEVTTPTAELRFPQGSGPFWVDVSRDGSVVVASEALPMEVLHKKTKKGVSIGFREQVTVTEEGILEPCAVDQRLKTAHETYLALMQSQIKYIFSDMLEKNISQETEDIARIIEEKTGEKTDYDREKHEKWLREERDFGEDKFKEAVETELPEYGELEREDRTRVREEVHEVMEFNKTVTYAGIEFNVTTVERAQKFRTRFAPEDKSFMIFNIDARNTSEKQVYVFYDDEVRLVREDNDNIPLEDYQMETSFEPLSECRGNFLFLIPDDECRFKLRFGKTSMAKIDLELDLNKINHKG